MGSLILFLKLLLQYLDSYSIKSGGIILRYLGKTCNATLKNRCWEKEHVAANTKYSGQHLVTMRSLSSPTRHQLPRWWYHLSPRLLAPPHPHRKTYPRLLVCLRYTFTLVLLPINKMDSVICFTTTTAKDSIASRKKTWKLKKKIYIQKELEHSIESDTRLLQ